jgi:2'-phosphotransferase
MSEQQGISSLAETASPADSVKRTTGDEVEFSNHVVPTLATTPHHDETSSYPQAKKQKNLKQLSHKLSLGLRHKALEFGWRMAPDGYVPVDDVLKHNAFRGYSVQDIQIVVETNDKQRYDLTDRPITNYMVETKHTIIQGETCVDTPKCNVDTILCIRANQGHSIPSVNPELLLDRLSSVELLNNIPMMVHGTYYDAWKLIRIHGLHKMTRNHIHFATGLPREESVISGMRMSCEVYIYVNIPKCVLDGIPIYRSQNGVLLTDGVDNAGTLPPEYFSMVTDKSGNDLMKDA